MKNAHGIVESNIRRTRIKDKNLLYNYYILKKYSTRKIAEIFNVEPSTVSRSLNRMKIKTEYRLKLNEKLIYKMYVIKLFSVSKISESFKCSASPVTRILKSMHVKIRNKDFYTKLSKNGRWLGGKSFEPYPICWNEKLREKIRCRDNYACQKCKKTKKERLSVHHIDYNKENCSKSNLITLCKSCHITTNSNRDYWYAYFTYIKENL
jgi:predicted transcriptional regulator